MKITIEPYNPNWPLAFEDESKLLLHSINTQGTAVEHIGSTAVQGLSAKSVIDILIGIPDFTQANDCIAPIEQLGYTYISEYENTMPYRRFFTKDQDGQRTHHIHLVAIGTEFWDRHLLFRDHLRNHPEDRDAYQQLKLSLATKNWKDGNAYAQAKTEFIRSIEAKTAE